MAFRTLIAAALLAGTLGSVPVVAQSSQSSQATSPGQSGASNSLPQAPSGGRATGGSASGPETSSEKQADTQAKKATGAVCQGC